MARQKQMIIRTKDYKELKEKKAEALWLALERIIPDIRERSKRPGSVVEVGKPVTHRRYNRRFRGTYGHPRHLEKIFGNFRVQKLQLMGWLEVTRQLPGVVSK